MNLKITGELNGEEREWLYENVRSGKITTARNIEGEEPALLIFYSTQDGEEKRVYLPFHWIRNMEVIHETLETSSSSISDSV